MIKLKIVGNDITLGGRKIGWISGDSVYDAGGRKVGYSRERENAVFDAAGRKIAYIEDNFLRIAGEPDIHLMNARKQVIGGDYSDLERCAIILLMKDEMQENVGKS